MSRLQLARCNFMLRRPVITVVKLLWITNVFMALPAFWIRPMGIRGEPILLTVLCCSTDMIIFTLVHDLTE